MQYYTVHHKENSTYMEIWHRGLKLPVSFGFTIVCLIYMNCIYYMWEMKTMLGICYCILATSIKVMCYQLVSDKKL